MWPKLIRNNFFKQIFHTNTFKPELASITHPSQNYTEEMPLL